MMEYAQREKNGTAVKSAAGTAREPIRQPGRAAYTHTATAIDLDAQLRERFRERFGTITDGVRILRDPALAPEGETAYARGDEIHIADGVRQDSDFGAQVLEHEFGHIVQQRMGLANGGGPLYDGALERSAEHMPPTDAAPLQAELAPVQMFPGPFSRYKPSRFSCFGKPTDALFNALTPNMEHYGNIYTRQRGNRANMDRRTTSNEAFQQLNIMRMKLDAAYTERQIGADRTLTGFLSTIDAQRNSQVANLMRIPEYTDGIANLRNRFDALPLLEDPPDPQAAVEAQLNLLEQLERDVIAFQSNQFYGAAYEESFKNLRNDIQQRYEDLFAWSIQRRLPFPRPQSLNAEAAARAQRTWNRILTRKSRIVIDPNAQKAKPGQPLSANNQMFAMHSPNYRKKRWRAGGGFDKRVLANLGRLLRTPTGEELLRGFTAPPPQIPAAQAVGIPARELARREHLVVIKATAPEDGERRPIPTGSSTVPLRLSGNGIAGKGDADVNTLPAFIPTGGYPAAAPPPPGMGAIVFTPGEERDSDKVDVAMDGTPLLVSQPVIMGHELMHAWHYQEGLSPRNYRTPEVAARYKNPEEYITMTGHIPFSLFPQIPQVKRAAFQQSVTHVNETALRRDMGMRMRDYHDARVAFRP